MVDDPLPGGPRTQLTRKAERDVSERAELYDLLDEAYVAHVAVARDWGPVVLPMLYARDDDTLLLHGSTGGGFFREAVDQPVTVAVTLVDGIVAARSTFNSSMNYRSAMIIGRATRITDDADAEHALTVISDHLIPGRVVEVRATTAKERAATSVLRLTIDEVSMKMRAAGPGDPEEHSEDVWAGVVPLAVRALDPVPAAEHVPDATPGEAVRTTVDRINARLPWTG